jgi:DNA helicase-2/ATP-dependent DNA helicase PcrA
MDAVLRGLDADQRAAVSVDAAPLAVIAAAGSGKTTVLTRRIARRIADGSAHASHVLVLTFTREAAGELRRRLHRLDPDRRDLTSIESGTFHAVALRLLADRATAQGRAAPVIAPDRARLIREITTETKRRIDPMALLADIDWARARRLHVSQLASASRRAKRRTSADPDTVADLWRRYDELKHRRGVVDFDDVLEGLLDALTRDPTFAEVVRWRFRHLFVDEAQDLNPLQFEVLEQIRAGRPDLCLVGDPRQAIYGWNGSDPTLLARIDERLPGITIVRLTGNHRCTPPIVRAGIAALTGAGVVDDTRSHRPDGRPVRVVECASDTDEATTVAQLARGLVQRHGARHVAVLARTNDQLGELGAALAAVGVRAETVTARGAAGPLERAISEATRTTSREALAAWVEGVWAVEHDAAPSGAPIVVPLGRAGAAAAAAAATSAARRAVAEVADRYLSSGAPGSLREWIEAHQPFVDEADDDDGAVALATFHGAKGREWRGVVVTGVEVGLVPHSGTASDEQREEEARLLHVAVTRAADDLVVTAAATRRGRATGPSPWLAAVRDAAADDEPVVAPPAEIAHRPVRPVDPLGPLRAWRAGVARAAGVPERAICSDQVLRSLVADPPADLHELATRLGLGDSVTARLGPRLLTLLAEPVRA